MSDWNSGRGKPGGPRCKSCQRHVRACSSNPCPEKSREKTGIWQAKEGSGVKLESSKSLEQSFEKISVDESLVLPPVPIQLQNLLLRKVYTVTLEQYSRAGMVVTLVLPDTLDKQKESSILALLLWSTFPAGVRLMSLEDRLKLAEIRVPIGSKFNVYVNSVENQRLFLTLATKPAPVLNYNYSGLIPNKLDNNHQKIEEKVEQPKSWSSIVGGSPSEVKKPSGPPKGIPLRGKITGSSKYRYLIIVDLEATCDYSPKPVVTPETAEIIEFPYVVLDTKTLEFVGEKQLYIKPDNLKGITPYCQVLTSITEDMVANGCFLKDAIDQFDAFVSSAFEPNSFRVVTDGVWDLSCQLRSESQRKQIPLSKWFNEYFDLKEEFRKFMPFFPFSTREPPLHIMLQAMQLDFVGKHHRGIDDCHSIALLVKAMLIAGHVFDTPVVISPDYNCQEDPSFLNFTSQAASNSWKCVNCSAKFSDKYCNDDPFRAVWNKPLASSCRFCTGPKPLDIHETRQCQICLRDFFLTSEEVEYFQAKRWYFPKNCINCRQLKTSIYLGE